MQAAGANACLIPSSDPHSSEYLPDHWKARAYFSGFTGSMGTLVVTDTASALWADGRYFIQAERQLAGSEIQLQKIAVEGSPTVTEYLTDALGEGQVLALDGMVTPTATVQELEKALAKKGAKDVVRRSGSAPSGRTVPPVPSHPRQACGRRDRPVLLPAENAGPACAKSWPRTVLPPW